MADKEFFTHSTVQQEKCNLEKQYQKIVNFIDKLDEFSITTVSSQHTVIKYIKQLESILDHVNKLNFFSTNENYKEIEPSHLKYILISAFIGVLHSNINTKRIEHLKLAKYFYQDFLKTCHMYEFPIQNINPDTNTDLRTQKIALYRSQQHINKELEKLKSVLLDNTGNDENQNDYNEKLIIDVEIDLLIKQKNLLPNQEEGEEEKFLNKHAAADEDIKFLNSSTIPLNNVRLAGKVFGKGYPSLPTMTVQQWYDEKTKREALAAEELGEIDEQTVTNEEESVKEIRNFDDWKDTHPRGWGNTYNKG